MPYRGVYIITTSLFGMKMRWRQIFSFPLILVDAVNGWCALLLNEFSFPYHSARATQPTMYDQVNFDIYIDVYTCVMERTIIRHIWPYQSGKVSWLIPIKLINSAILHLMGIIKWIYTIHYKDMLSQLHFLMKYEQTKLMIRLSIY